MGRVSRDARLAFIMLWTIADDAGRLRGNSRMLASLLFPYDDDAKGLIDGWLAELQAEGCIAVYKVGGDSYIEICNWLIHQKIDKPSKSKIPPFDESSRILANPREGSSEDQRKGSKEGIKGSEDGSGVELHVPDGTCSSSPSTGDDLNDKRVVNFPKADPVDYQGVVDLYHRLLCPPMQRCLILSDKRKAHLRQRWRDALPNLSEWEAYFQHIAKSDFLMGRSTPAPGRKPFVADLDWIIKSENFVKIAERKYHA